MQPEIRPDAQWRRLSPRMLLIHPIREVGRAVPALAGILLAGTSAGHEWWSLLALGVVIGLSLLRWFTTTYQISTGQVQLRTGLIRRRTMTTPTDRVRTVDVTAHALHRALGLARVVIGTGTSDRKREGLVLDGLPAAAAGALRAELLHRRVLPDLAGPPGATGGPDAPGGPGGPGGRGQPLGQPSGAATVGPERVIEERVLVTFNPAWVRFAPFTLSGVVTGLAVVGLLWRALNQANVQADRVGVVRGAARHLRNTPVWLDVVQVSIGFLVVTALLSVAGYLLSFWNFRLTRHPGGSLHISRGLLTSRATSIEERRLRGVEVSQFLPLRLVGGARLLAVATGLRVGRGAERGGTVLVPACPAVQADQVAALVLGEQRGDQLIDGPLRPAGPGARTRRFTRALIPTGIGWLLIVLVWWTGLTPGWPVALGVLLPAAGGVLAQDRYRSLGHDLRHGYLITRYGSLDRRRVLLQQDGIIGWNLRQSFFQRRAGLITLTATTAAGRQGYPVTDLPIEQAVQLASAATPGLLELIRPSGSVQRVG